MRDQYKVLAEKYERIVAEAFDPLEKGAFLSVAYLQDILKNFEPVNFDDFIHWFIHHKLPRQSISSKGFYSRHVNGVSEYIEDLVDKQLCDMTIAHEDEDEGDESGDKIVEDVEQIIMGQFYREYIAYKKVLNKNNPGVPSEF